MQNKTFSEICQFLYPLYKQCNSKTSVFSRVYIANRTSLDDTYFSAEFIYQAKETNIITGHIFSLDLVKIKELLDIQGTIFTGLAMPECMELFLGEYYFEIHNYLACFNGIANDYEKIVEVMMNNKTKNYGKILSNK